MRNIRFFEEKRAIALLKYCKALNYSHDRTADIFASRQAYLFWSKHWTDDFVDDNGNTYVFSKGKLYHKVDGGLELDKDMTAFWQTEVIGWIKKQVGTKKINNKRIDEFYDLRDSFRLPAAERSIPTAINNLALKLGIKIWRSDSAWKLSGFQIMKDKQCLAGKGFVMTQDEMIQFIMDYSQKHKGDI